MKQERIEAFANEIKEKNRYNKLTQTISFYVMVLGWITYCIVNDYAAVWAGQGLIPTGLVLLYVVNLWMYCMSFVNGYTKVEGKGGKSVQDIRECVHPMPFAFDDYLNLIQKKFTKVLLCVGVLHIISVVVGMFVFARVNAETDRMEYIWSLPTKMGTTFAFCIIINVLFLVAMYSFFCIQKYRVMRLVSSEDKKSDERKRNNRFVPYMQIMLLVLGVAITLVVLFIGLFQHDTDPFLTICFMVLLLAVLPLRYWYITLLVIVLAVIFIVTGAKKRKQLQEHSELFNRSKTKIIGKHVLLLCILQVGILFMVPLIYNIYAEENVAGYFMLQDQAF